MDNSERIVLILGGGDWADASVTDLIVPEGMDLEQQKNNWRKWYEESYIPALRHQVTKEKVRFINFTNWLIQQGCRPAELETFDDM